MKPGGLFALALGLGLVGAAIGCGRHHRRRNPLAGWRDDVPSSTMKKLGSELDEAERRARAAGAEGKLEWMGAGMTGIVFCDSNGQAFKVARKPMQEDRADESRIVEDEAKWLQAASRLGFAKHVARGVKYDRKNHVLVRECVRKSATRDQRVNEARLRNLHDRLAATMRQHGWSAPEYKPDSYVYTRDRGPVLVDAGFAHRRGRELVRDTLDVLNDRRKLARRENLPSIAWEIRMERGESIPADVANKLLRRLQARDPAVEL